MGWFFVNEEQRTHAEQASNYNADGTTLYNCIAKCQVNNLDLDPMESQKIYPTHIAHCPTTPFAVNLLGGQLRWMKTHKNAELLYVMRQSQTHGVADRVAQSGGSHRRQTHIDTQCALNVVPLSAHKDHEKYVSPFWGFIIFNIVFTMTIKAELFVVRRIM